MLHNLLALAEKAKDQNFTIHSDTYQTKYFGIYKIMLYFDILSFFQTAELSREVKHRKVSFDKKIRAPLYLCCKERMVIS